MQEPDFSSPELADLYEELAPQLVRIVSKNLTAPESVIEDACQLAWSWLIQNRESVEVGGELGWLSTTATRAALRQLRTRRHEVSYEAESDGEEELSARTDPGPGPDRIAEYRERLAEIHTLPVRQQQMLWLHGFGYGYVEIAEHTGDSLRTVERQLLRAKRRLARSA